MYGYITNSSKRYGKNNTSFTITIAYLSIDDYNRISLKSENINFSANSTVLIEKDFCYKNVGGSWYPINADDVPEDVYEHFSHFYPLELGYNNCIGCETKHRSYVKRCTNCGLKIQRHKK